VAGRRGLADASRCSHLERARWIVGDGLGNAIDAFNERRPEIKVE